jgi:hypothetical protein
MPHLFSSPDAGAKEEVLVVKKYLFLFEGVFAALCLCCYQDRGEKRFHERSDNQQRNDNPHEEL